MDTIDQQIQKTLLRDQGLSKEYGVDLNISVKNQAIFGDKLVDLLKKVLKFFVKHSIFHLLMLNIKMLEMWNNIMEMVWF